MERLGISGCGHMAKSLLLGPLQQGVPSAKLLVSDRGSNTYFELYTQCGVKALDVLAEGQWHGLIKKAVTAASQQAQELSGAFK